MKKCKVADLVLDFGLYPRGDVDSHHVAELASAMAAGVVLPPVMVCASSMRVVDGFHRVRAYAKLLGADGEIEVVAKGYRDEGALFADAMRLNAGHGRRLSGYDRALCVAKAGNFELSDEVVAGALSISVTAVGELRAERVGRVRGPGAGAVALKGTIKHMRGQALTKGQVAANGKLGGMGQGFYVSQLILLLENGLLNREDARLMGKVGRLRELLGEVVCEVV